MSMLFSDLSDTEEKHVRKPLAAQMRPERLEDVVGQDHLLSSTGLLTGLISSGTPASLIFWGPAGCGKTTLARLYAKAFDAEFVQLSAVMSGIADVKKIVSEAEHLRHMGKRVMLFVDEVHRFNKAQQDAFLPHVEEGVFTFIGATTENPSFSINNALLSRTQVVQIHALSEAALDVLFARAETLLGVLPLAEDAQKALKHFSGGDGRYFLGLLEKLHQQKKRLKKEEQFSLKDVETLLQKRAPAYDKDGDMHYDLISVLHKAVRGSDVDGALFWFCRMIEGGEDPRYIARRMVRMAVEDISLADPQALLQAEMAAQAYQRLGSPEGELALAQALVYLASAPKSNAVYTAFKQAKKYAQKNADAPAPLFARNAPTSLMAEAGYSDGYVYDHDVEHAVAGQNFFPETIKRQTFYTPVNRGFERDVLKRLAFYEKTRTIHKKP